MTPHRHRIPTWVKWIYLCGVVGVLMWAVAGSIDSIQRWRHLFEGPAPYLFMAAWMLMAGVLGAWWTLFLRWRFAVHLPVRDWLPVQALAWGGRYLPGKLGLFAGKLALVDRPGLGGRRLAYSVFWEQLAFVLSALVAAALFLAGPVAGSHEVLVAHWDWLRFVAGMAGVAAFLSMDAVFKRFFPEPLEPAQGLGLGKRFGLLLIYLLPHLLVGMAAYPLLCALIPEAAPLGIPGTIGLLALANLAGILAVFAPAGMGVREAVLGFGLLAFAPLPVALAFSAVLRLLTLLADVAFFLLAGGGSLLYQRRSLRTGRDVS